MRRSLLVTLLASGLLLSFASSCGVGTPGLPSAFVPARSPHDTTFVFLVDNGPLCPNQSEIEFPSAFFALARNPIEICVPQPDSFAVYLRSQSGVMQLGSGQLQSGRSQLAWTGYTPLGLPEPGVYSLLVAAGLDTLERTIAFVGQVTIRPFSSRLVDSDGAVLEIPLGTSGGFKANCVPGFSRKFPGLPNPWGADDEEFLLASYVFGDRAREALFVVSSGPRRRLILQIESIDQTQIIEIDLGEAILGGSGELLAEVISY